MVFYSRGTLYFKDITNLANQAPVMTFEHKNPQAAINMAKLNIINQSMMYQRTLNREYMQWDTVAGLTKSGKPDNGSVMITSGTAGALDNQNDAIIPMIDCELFGNSSFAPGIVVNVVLHLGIPDKVIDEAVPEVQIINRVTHHQLGSRYLCRVELGVLNK
ncbi:tail length [Photobacterium aphoticum]|uniref:Tail length n=1 Tax=Photobacterium aphoticum TaxID=754436 RepID=A0A090R1E3_9GAMM|nr:tail length [Photobacterium aphoticum]